MAKNLVAHVNLDMILPDDVDPNDADQIARVGAQILDHVAKDPNVIFATVTIGSLHYTGTYREPN